MNARYFGLSGLFCGTSSRGKQLILVSKRRRLEAPVLLEVERTGAALAASVVEDARAALAGAPHQLPVLEVVGGEIARVRGVAGVVRQHLVAEVEAHHAAQRSAVRSITIVSTSQQSPNTSRKRAK